MKRLEKHTKLIGWLANIVTIAGVFLTSRNIFPLNLIVLSTACALWVITGILWRRPELWTLNAVILVIYLSGFLH